MSGEQVHNEPSKVEAQEGSVTIRGPDDIEVRLTPDAAAATSNRLLVAAMKALSQSPDDEDAGDEEDAADDRPDEE